MSGQEVLAPGVALPPLQHVLTAVDLMAYGAATWDWYACHYSDATARRLGFPAAFADGQLWGAWFARQLRAGLGPGASVRAMRLRYHAMAFVGDRLTGTAVITALREEPAERIIEIRHGLERDGTPIATCQSLASLPR